MVVALVLGMGSAAASGAEGHRAAVPMAERVVGGRALVVPAQDAEDGLATAGGTTYTVDVAGRAIHVAVDLTATNLIPPTSQGYAYFDAVGVFTLAEAVNLVATTADGTPLDAELEAIDGTEIFAFVRIDLPNQLLYEETHAVRLTYDLPDQGARSPRITRVNPAFAAVVPFPFGDPGAADVSILVPDTLDVDVLGETELTRSDAGDHDTYTATAIPDPFAFDATVVARDLDALERTDPGGAHDVEVAAWPGDAEWAGFVAGLVRDGLPVMEELIGQPWPVDGSLDIVETVAPYLYGYAGWFDTSEDRIEVGDELHAGVVLHELSHAWFQHQHFTDRWINEGLAEEVSARVLEHLGLPAPPPAPIDPAAPGAIRLADWSTPALTAEISDDQETYGYNTSYGVVRALADEIGIEGLARVVDAAFEDRIAYLGDPEAEPWRPITDWRRFLDLLEEQGGSVAASGLFAAHVVAAADAPVLERRTATRAAYDALDAAGAGWTPPLAVRDAMAHWDFDRADAELAVAREVLTTRDAIVAAVEPLGLRPPTGLEVAYEEAQDLERVWIDAADLLASVEALVAADAAVRADRGLLESIGLLGGGAEDHLDAATDAFRRGDAEDVEEASGAAVDAVDAAGRRGLERVGTVLALLVLVATALTGLRALAAGADGGVVTGVLRRLSGGARGRRSADAPEAMSPPPGPPNLWGPPESGPPSPFAPPPPSTPPPGQAEEPSR